MKLPVDLLKKVISTVPVIFTALAAVGILIVFSEIFTRQEPVISPIEAYPGQDYDIELDFRIKRIEELLEGNQIVIDTTEVQRIDNLERKMDVLDDALEQDIERALSIAMIRRDVDEIRRSTSERNTYLNERLDSLYDLVLSLLAIVGSLTIAAIGWAIAVLVRQRRES